jgi:hypothetical protein
MLSIGSFNQVFSVFTYFWFLLSVCSDMSLRITLWGQRAKDFSISDVGNKEDSKPIVVLFVGCLAKQFQGS